MKSHFNFEKWGFNFYFNGELGQVTNFQLLENLVHFLSKSFKFIFHLG